MQHTNGFAPSAITYSELLDTVSDIEELLYQFQSEIVLHITKHVYPYTIEITYLSGYFQFHIFSIHNLFHLCYMIQDILLSPF